MKKVKIGDRYIGENEPVFIIAEAGLNHNGNIEMAKKLIEMAKEVGADAVKFQSYHTENFVSEESKYYQLFKSLELSEEEFKELNKYAKKNGIIFLSTPLDLEYVDILNEIGVHAFKIASGDLTFTPLLKKVAKMNKPIVLSTGMATIGEIDEAITTIKNTGNDDIILLHCISSYPTKFEDLNLRAIKTVKEVFRLPVGFSDHSMGVYATIASVALGAVVIEKHFTLDKNLPGPDHMLSSNPEEFKQLVNGIRIVEKALGDGYKRPMSCEKDARIHGRRSIIAKRYINKGENLTEENIAYKRPAYGIEPKFTQIILNKKIKSDKNRDDIIYWDDLFEV